jgi:hypothetical protein
MPKILLKTLLACTLVLSSFACKKEALPAEPFIGVWLTKQVPNHGFTLQVEDGQTLSGVVYESGEAGQVVETPFAGGRWQLSDDQKTLTLDFGTTTRFGRREYNVLGPLDHNVVRLKIREKNNAAAPLLTLER